MKEHAALTAISILAASEILDCCTSTVRALVKSGKLTKIPIHSRCWMVYEEEVRGIELPGSGAHNKTEREISSLTRSGQHRRRKRGSHNSPLPAAERGTEGEEGKRTESTRSGLPAFHKHKYKPVLIDEDNATALYKCRCGIEKWRKAVIACRKTKDESSFSSQASPPSADKRKERKKR